MSHNQRELTHSGSTSFSPPFSPQSLTNNTQQLHSLLQSQTQPHYYQPPLPSNQSLSSLGAQSASLGANNSLAEPSSERRTKSYSSTEGRDHSVDHEVDAVQSQSSMDGKKRVGKQPRSSQEQSPPAAETASLASQPTTTTQNNINPATTSPNMSRVLSMDSQPPTASESQKENRTTTSGRPSQAAPSQPSASAPGGTSARYQSLDQYKQTSAKPKPCKDVDFPESWSDDEGPPLPAIVLSPEQERRKQTLTPILKAREADEHPFKATQGEVSMDIDEGHESKMWTPPKPTAERTMDMSLDGDSQFGVILPPTQKMLPKPNTQDEDEGEEEQAQNEARGSGYDEYCEGSLDNSIEHPSPIALARHTSRLGNLDGIGISNVAGSSQTEEPLNQSQLSYEPTQAHAETSHLQEPIRFTNRLAPIHDSLDGTLEPTQVVDQFSYVEPTQLDEPPPPEEVAAPGVEIFRERMVSNNSTTSAFTKRSALPESRQLKRNTPQPQTSSPPAVLSSPHVARVQQSEPNTTDSSSPAPADNVLKQMEEEEEEDSPPTKVLPTPAPPQKATDDGSPRPRQSAVQFAQPKPVPLPPATQQVDETVELDQAPNLESDDEDEDMLEDDDPEPVVLVAATPDGPDPTAEEPEPAPSPVRRSGRAVVKAKAAAASKSNGAAGPSTRKGKGKAPVEPEPEAVQSSPLTPLQVDETVEEEKEEEVQQHVTRRMSARKSAAASEDQPRVSRAIAPSPLSLTKNSKRKRDSSPPATRRHSAASSVASTSMGPPPPKSRSKSVGSKAQAAPPPEPARGRRARTSSVTPKAEPEEQGPLRLLTLTPAAPRAAIKLSRKTDDLFSHVGFLATITAAEPTPSTKRKGAETTGDANIRVKNELAVTFEKHGGIQLDPRDLFSVKPGKKVQVDFALAALHELTHVFLLADSHSTTPKYMNALALGIPVVSHKFVHACVEAKELLDWRDFALGAGHINDLAITGVGSQGRVLAKTTFNLQSIADAHKAKALFTDDRFLTIVGPKRKAAQGVNDLRAVLAAAGAAKADFIDATEVDAGAEAVEHVAGEYDYLLIDADVGKAGLGELTELAGVVTNGWFKQCLIAGRKLAPSQIE